MRRFSRIAALIICFAFAASSQPASWGDQGDGTYKNPILNADYPDVDVEKLGDTYYMISSTNHFAPGMILLESKDLVNWTIIGHVFDRLDWEPQYNYDRMDGYSFGVWAGDLAYNDGKWYCYFVDTRSGLYMSEAEDIRGPWTRARLMLKKTNWTDPAVYWDREKKEAWLVVNFGRDPENPGAGNQTRMFRMSWDGRRLLDEGKVIYRGPGAEAAKIYVIDGTWYIFISEWRGSDRKQLVLRGPGPYGPFERKVVMDRHDALDRSTCQGALVQAPDGSWWLTHQLVQHRALTDQDLAGPSTTKSYEGRSQWLVPVTWKDGWPMPGHDADGDGIGETVFAHRKPVDGFPVAAPQTSDEFSAPGLGHQWEWNHNPNDERWSLAERPGWLRLKASVPVGEGGFWRAPNTISQRIMGTGKGVATAKLDLSGVKPGQQAGFCHQSGQYVLAGVRVDDGGARRLVFNHDGNVTLGPEIGQDTVYFRTDIDGNQATVSYSLDGEDWKPLGRRFELTFGRWRGDRLGFYCWNEKSPAGHIDIDWFRHTYDGPLGGR